MPTQASDSKQTFNVQDFWSQHTSQPSDLGLNSRLQFSDSALREVVAINGSPLGKYYGKIQWKKIIEKFY